MDSLNEVILAQVTALLVFALTYVRQWVKSRLAPSQLSTVLQLARTVVQAAEKVGADLGVGGAEKYEYAEQALIAVARRVGLRLKPEEANGFIHAVLAEMDEFEALDESPIVPAA